MNTHKSQTAQKSIGKRNTSLTSSRLAGKSIQAAIADFLLDRESRNFSKKTLIQHCTSLKHLAKFLETHHEVTSS